MEMIDTSTQYTLDEALRQFEATEANLSKLEKVWVEIEKLTPSDVQFGGNKEYDRRRMIFKEILQHLPNIDGWNITNIPEDLNTIAQMRFDAQELGEIEITVKTEEGIEAPGKDIAEYRFRFNSNRRHLVRDKLVTLISKTEAAIILIAKSSSSGNQTDKEAIENNWLAVQENIAQIDILLGSTYERPKKWDDLRRHLFFDEEVDRQDILQFDWPKVNKELRVIMYEGNDPVKVEVDDLIVLLHSNPSGAVVTELKWGNLSDKDFERVIFTLISNEDGYEKPEWLTDTNAPDRGRDLSVERTIIDPLAGKLSNRVIIQCKNWLTHSVSVSDVSTLKEQMKLWEPPRVDILTIATSGRFTTDAIQAIETHNQSDTALTIEMWPNSHLERLLAKRPDIMAEYKLR